MKAIIKEEPRRNRRHYTLEENDYLKSYAGIYTIDKMAKALGRTPLAIKEQLVRLGVGNLDLSGGIPANQFARIAGVAPSTVRTWVKRDLLPHSKRSARNNVKMKDKRCLIFPEQFWKWAEQNKHRVPFSKIQRNVLLPEPDWLDAEIRKEKSLNKKILNKSDWTIKEEQEAWQLRAEGVMYKDIAIRLKRTHSSVRNKMHDLIQREKELANQA